MIILELMYNRNRRCFNVGVRIEDMPLILYLICKFFALPIQKQIKIWCQIYGQMRYNYLIDKKTLWEKEKLFVTSFQKLSVVDSLK